MRNFVAKSQPHFVDRSEFDSVVDFGSSSEQAVEPESKSIYTKACDRKLESELNRAE